ncbi:unnamed protein product, partial [Owenia fusiformis]
TSVCFCIFAITAATLYCIGEISKIIEPPIRALDPNTLYSRNIVIAICKKTIYKDNRAPYKGTGSLDCLKWKTLEMRRNDKNLVIMYKICRGLSPDYIIELFDKYKNEQVRDLRSHQPFKIPVKASARLRKSPVLRLINQWNKLSEEERVIPRISIFKTTVRKKKKYFQNFNTTSKLNLSRKQEIILNRIRCGLYFKSQKFAHNFTGISDNLCICGESETPKHFIFNCQRLSTRRHEFIESLEQHNLENLLPRRQEDRIKALLFENNLSLEKDCILKKKFINFIMHQEI